MSELKAYIAPTPDGTGLADYYLKSEADKVIARHKYKRCLAMAELCQYRSEMFFTWSKKMGFLLKWQKRWQGLAEKFKEVK